MTTMAVNVKLGLNASGKQQVVVFNCLLSVKFIILAGAGQKRRTRIGWDGKIHRIPARVNQCNKIRPAALTFDWIRRGGLPRIVTHMHKRSERSSRRKPQNSHTLWIDAPLFGICAADTEGTLRVLQRLPFNRVLVTRSKRKTVLQNGSRDPALIQPLCNLRPFVWPPQLTMSTPRRNDDHRAISLLLWWKVNGNYRIVDILDVKVLPRFCIRWGLYFFLILSL